MVKNMDIIQLSVAGMKCGGCVSNVENIYYLILENLYIFLLPDDLNLKIIKGIGQKLVFSIDYSTSFFFIILLYLFFLKNHLCKSLMGNHSLLDFRELILFLNVSG